MNALYPNDFDINIHNITRIIGCRISPLGMIRKKGVIELKKNITFVNILNKQRQNVNQDAY